MVTRSLHKLQLKDVHDYVTIVYDQNRSLGYVLEKNEIND